MAASLPKTIKAVYQDNWKENDDLFLHDVPLPTPSDPEDHLIKVHATAPTLGELTWARNFSSVVPQDREMVPGQDLSGVVVQAPEGSPFKAGDEVYALQDFERAGALREYTLSRTRVLALKPKNLSFVDAAALPMSALTAYQGLFFQGPLNRAALEGDEAARAANAKLRVLVTAAGGGVGSAALQFASAAGAGAGIAVAGPSKAQVVRKLGATEFVDYTKQSLAEWAAEDPSRQVDFIFECIGGDSLVGSWTAIKEGGSLISICAPPDSVKPEGNTKSLKQSLFFIVERDGPQLGEISKLADRGLVKPNIDSVVEFADFQKAYDKVNSRHASGKVIIKVAA